MNWLIHAIREIAYYEKIEDVPRPPEYVYHATPYVHEILEGGFEINPERQTFGGHGTYVSTTTKEEAQKYAEDLKIIVGFLNRELSWEDAEGIFSKRGLSRAFNAAITNRAFNDLASMRNSLHDQIADQYSEENWEDAWRDAEKLLSERLRQPLEEAYKNSKDPEYAKRFFFSQLNLLGEPLTDAQETKRRWDILQGMWSYSDDQFALLFGDTPTHLLNKSMDDVGVVEIAIAPTAPASTSHYEKPEDTKGKFTYNPSEKEWRFYDPTDLLPVRLVAAADITITEECTGAHHGQIDMVVRAVGTDGKILGQVLYSIYQGEIYINIIEVDEGSKRQGIATAMMEHLVKDNKYEDIKWGWLTAEEAALQKHLDKVYGFDRRTEDTEVNTASQHMNIAIYKLSQQLRLPGIEPSLSDLKELLPEIAQAAQKVYDAWEQDEEGVDEEYGGGGICHDIAEEISGILNENGIDATSFHYEVGENHVAVICKLNDGVYVVDIPPDVYESGSGYIWKKLTEVEFTPSDVIIDHITSDTTSFDQYIERGF